MAIDYISLCSGKLMTSDYSGASNWQWQVRRIVIGASIAGGYALTVLAILSAKLFKSMQPSAPPDYPSKPPSHG